MDHLVACGAALAVDTHLRRATDLAAAGLVAADLIFAAGVVAADPTIAGAAERLLEAAVVAGTALGGWGAPRAAALGDAVGTDAIEAVTQTALAISAAGTPLRLESALADVVATGLAILAGPAQLTAGATLRVGGPAQAETRVAGTFDAAAVRDALFGAVAGITLAVSADAMAH